MRQNQHLSRPITLGMIDKQLAKVHPRLGVIALERYFSDDELLELNIVEAASFTFGSLAESPRNPAAFLAAAINRNRDRWLEQAKPTHVRDYGPASWGEASRGHCIECGRRRPAAGE